MVGFYGLDIFLAETSATCGGLDSLLEPTGPLREAQQLAAEAFGARQTYFVTNGTSTANKIVAQALVAPRRHRAGRPQLPPVPPLRPDAGRCAGRSIWTPTRSTSTRCTARCRCARSSPSCWRCSAAGKLDRVKMLMLTNCTFDGIVYDVERVMEECLAIKPDLVFLWDEAWFAFARFHPVYRPRTGMRSARALAATAPRRRSTGAEYEADAGSRFRGPDRRRGAAGPPAAARSGPGPGAGLRDPVDAQDADLAAAGLDDPRVRPGLRRRRSRRPSTRPTWRTPRPRRTTRSWRRWTSAGGRSPWKASSWCSADRERHAAARRDRQPSAAAASTCAA